MSKLIQGDYCGAKRDGKDWVCDDCCSRWLATDSWTPNCADKPREPEAHESNVPTISES